MESHGITDTSDTHLSHFPDTYYNIYIKPVFFLYTWKVFQFP